jgi:hypothetical protein
VHVGQETFIFIHFVKEADITIVIVMSKVSGNRLPKVEDIVSPPRTFRGRLKCEGRDSSKRIAIVTPALLRATRRASDGVGIETVVRRLPPRFARSVRGRHSLVLLWVPVDL